jgi:hypothetical protein
VINLIAVGVTSQRRRYGASLDVRHTEVSEHGETANGRNIGGATKQTGFKDEREGD